jgi:hypothetical protein
VGIRSEQQQQQQQQQWIRHDYPLLSRSTRRLRSTSADAQHEAHLQQQKARVYDVFDDRLTAHRLSQHHLPPAYAVSERLHVPSNHVQPPSGACTPVYMPPQAGTPVAPHLWPTVPTTMPPSDNYSSLSSVSNSAHKSRARNCMIGWMLAVTAVIILALAIALFVQGRWA